MNNIKLMTADSTLADLLDALIESSYLHGGSGQRIVSSRCAELRQAILARFNQRPDSVVVSREDWLIIVDAVEYAAGMRSAYAKAWTVVTATPAAPSGDA